jgi:hypothetical protein
MNDSSDILQFSRDGNYLVSSSYTQVWIWSTLNEQIISDRLLVMEFYDALSRADYEDAAALFQPGEYEVTDYQSPDANSDLASQLEYACEQGKLICRPVLRILPGGGMTNLGDDIVYFQFKADDGSVFKDPNGFSNLYIYVGPDKNGTLKISYPARME